MVGVPEAIDGRTGAPIVSLYGNRFEDLCPRPEQLDGLDTLLIDLCDVGSRYYTFVWTALLAVRAAARSGVHCVVLDRPNPIGGAVGYAEGRPQQPGFLSFVGLEPTPVRHSLTIGELIAEMATREGLILGEDGALEVVPTQGWDRTSLAWHWDRAFVLPSPNMPTVDTALVYPGGCLLEGTNLSEGRGTTRPFEIFGAPWLDGHRLATELNQEGLAGFKARPLTFRPTFHKYANRTCGGIQVHVTDPERFRPLACYLTAITMARRMAPDQFRFRKECYEFVEGIPAIDLLVGTDEVRQAMERNVPPADLRAMVCPVPSDYAESHAQAVDRVHRRRE